MEFFSGTEESSDKEPVQVLRSMRIENCLSICIISFYIRKTLDSIKSSIFQKKDHASPYNTYMREKEKVIGNKLDLFVRLRSIGIVARIAYIVHSRTLSVYSYVEIVSGSTVVSEKDMDTKHKSDTESAHISVDVYGKVSNHTLYTNKKISFALEAEIDRNTDKNSPFYEYDARHISRLPITRKEGMLHPLYRIDPEHKRYIVYPKSIGWVGHIKETRTKKHSLKSSTQKEKGLRIFPRSHIIKLLTQNEIVQQNRRTEENALPFRILPSKSPFHPDGLKVYAPWQIHPQPINPNIIATPKQIPCDSVYLLETRIVRYSIEHGTTPVIGRKYDYITQRNNLVTGGVLVSREYFTKNREAIIRDIHRSIIRSILAENRLLIVNIQVLSAQALRYIGIVEILDSDK